MIKAAGLSACGFSYVFTLLAFGIACFSLGYTLGKDLNKQK